MVSAAKLRRAQDAIVAARPYARAAGPDDRGSRCSPERGARPPAAHLPAGSQGGDPRCSPLTVASPAASTPTSSAALAASPTSATAPPASGSPRWAERALKLPPPSPRDPQGLRAVSTPAELRDGEGAGRGADRRVPRGAGGRGLLVYNEFVSAITQQVVRRPAAAASSAPAAEEGQRRAAPRSLIDFEYEPRSRRCWTSWCRRPWPSASTGRCSRGGLRARRAHERDGERDQQRRRRHRPPDPDLQPHPPGGRSPRS